MTTTTLYAFQAQAPSQAVPGFSGTTVTMTASRERLEEKIRTEAHCPEAEVSIVPPEEWGAPELRSLTQSELGAKFPLILSLAQSHMRGLGVPSTDPSQLIQDGCVVTLPRTGKVFFVYKIREAAIGSHHQ